MWEKVTLVRSFISLLLFLCIKAVSWLISRLSLPISSELCCVCRLSLSLFLAPALSFAVALSISLFQSPLVSPHFFSSSASALHNPMYVCVCLYVYAHKRVGTASGDPCSMALSSRSHVCPRQESWNDGKHTENSSHNQHHRLSVQSLSSTLHLCTYVQFTPSGAHLTKTHFTCRSVPSKVAAVWSLFAKVCQAKLFF